MSIRKYDQEIRLLDHLSLAELASVSANVTGFGQLYVKSSDNNLYFKRSGNNGEVTFQPGSINLSALSALLFTTGDFVYYNGTTLTTTQGDAMRTLLGLGTGNSPTFTNLNTTGNVTVNGNLTVLGTMTTVNAQTVDVTSNTITLNNGEVGAGVTAGVSGVIIDRGSLPNYEFLFEESTQTIMIGKVGNLQPVATRQLDAAMNDNSLIFWDSASNSIFSATKTAANGLFYDNSGDTGILNISNTILNVTGNLATFANGVTVSGGSLTLSSLNTDTVYSTQNVLILDSSNVVHEVSLTNLLSWGNTFTTTTQTSDAITQGTVHLFRSGSNAAAFNTDYGVNMSNYATLTNLSSYFNKTVDNSDAITQGTVHLFRSGSNAAALNTDYGFDISQYSSTTSIQSWVTGHNYFSTTTQNSDAITQGTTHLFRSGTTTTALFNDYGFDVSSISTNGFTSLTDGTTTVTASMSGESIQFIGSGATITAAAPSAGLKTITISVDSDKQYSMAIVTGVNYAVIGPQNTFLSVILDYIYVSGTTYQEGTARGLWNGTIFNMNHDYQNNLVVGAAEDFVVTSLNNDSAGTRFQLNNAGTSGTLRWKVKYITNA
jgi:hypothetical protein